jgi:hypothetical protein
VSAVRSRREEMAWAAGFFDGEGHTRVNYISNRYGRHFASLLLSVSQANDGPGPPSVLLRFQAAFNEGRINGPYRSGRPNERPMWRWRCSGIKAAEVLGRMWPWLDTVKQDQADRAIAELETWRVARGRRGQVRSEDPED